ncbi:SWIRM-domain-containing protein [Hesseltinella vesiculosa]|uniref:SWIRM-domain-containing protein n=1 Tax=Hesseltinella vesiculosa TaxID=101127 RepID=A0A1X2GDM6_9FUNG|nr:SWIRM-domain-containing protein [Hesseltinella vesiculosa]
MSASSLTADPVLPPCLPASVFDTANLNPTSPLYILLLTALVHEPDTEQWHFYSKAKRNAYLAMIDAIYDKLQLADLYQPPKIAFAAFDETNSDMARLVDRIAELKGVFVQNTAEATHVIHFNQKEQDYNQRRPQRTIRVVERKDDGGEIDPTGDADHQVLVHWCGLPDAYDQWLPHTKVKDFRLAEDGPSSTPLHLSVDWLTDSYTYNTWLNPADYPAQPDVANELPVNKRAPEAMQDTQKTAKRPRSESYLCQQPYEVIIPSYASWFEFHKIHRNERLALPEFFTVLSTKSPMDYMDMRNFMIHSYRLNPLEYLTVTATRRNLLGDACAIYRVHAFLEHWGLINYQIDPRLKVSTVGPPLNGEFKVVLDVPRACQSNKHPTEPAMTKPTTSAHTTTSAPTLQPQPSRSEKSMITNLDLRKAIFETPTASIGKDEADLTRQQQLLLLEGLAMYSHDWNAVAKHVGISRDACLLHYLKLPLDDPYLDKDMSKNHPSLDQNRVSQLEDPLHWVATFLQHATPDGVDLPSTTSTSQPSPKKQFYLAQLAHYRQLLSHFLDKEKLIQQEREMLSIEQRVVMEERLQLYDQLQISSTNS